MVSALVITFVKGTLASTGAAQTTPVYIKRKTIARWPPSVDKLKKKRKKKNDLRSNESREHYHEDGNIAPILR